MTRALNPLFLPVLVISCLWTAGVLNTDEAQAHLDAVEGASWRSSAIVPTTSMRPGFPSIAGRPRLGPSARIEDEITEASWLWKARQGARPADNLMVASLVRADKWWKVDAWRKRERNTAEDFLETRRVIHEARETPTAWPRVSLVEAHGAPPRQFRTSCCFMGNQWTAFAINAWDVATVGRRSVPVSRIAPLVEGLRRAGRLPQVLQRYRQRFDEDARDLVKTVVSECAGGTDDDVCGEVAAARLAALDASAFQSCLDLCLEHLLASVCGAVALHNALSALLTSRVDPSVLIKNDQALSEIEDDDLVRNSRDGVGELCEGVLKRVGRLVQLRKEQNARLKQSELRRVWASSLSFASAIERATGEPAFALRSALVAQARAFLEKRHSDAKAALVACLDAERWAQADVTPERQSRLIG